MEGLGWPTLCLKKLYFIANFKIGVSHDIPGRCFFFF